MAREQAPAFQYYPRDLMSDPNVLAMDAETFGTYWWLVSICWLNQSIPDDPGDCAALCRGKVDARRFARMWPALRSCFTPDGNGQLRHTRLDRERVSQAESKARRAAAASKRWSGQHGNAGAKDEQSTCNADAKQCSSSSSSSSSSTSTAVSVPHASASTLVVPLAKPLGFRSRIDVAWPGRPPVPGALHAELRERMAGDETANDAALRAWYPTVAGAYAQQDIGDDPWKFWNARFREWRGTTVKPVKAAEPALDTEQMLANIRQKEARLGRR